MTYGAQSGQEALAAPGSVILVTRVLALRPKTSKLAEIVGNEKLKFYNSICESLGFMVEQG